MAENSLFSSIGSLVHQLRGSITFVLSIYEVLDQKLPETAGESWKDLGQISERVLIEIEDQLGYMLANIDAYSSTSAATRIADLASGWEKDVEQLLHIVDRISGLCIQLEDPKLNAILNVYLQSSILGFGRIVSFVKQIRPEDLLLD